MSKKRGGKNLTEDDLRLWEKVKKSVRPLSGEPVNYSPPSSEKKVILPVEVSPKRAPEMSQAPAVKKAGIDHRTQKKLKRGQLKIDARVDLHGMTRDEAYSYLTGAINKYYNAGYRNILVITGKGTRSAEPGGVLRRKVPQWLSLDDRILDISVARPQDGGDGAFYVLLRRKR